MKTNTINWLLEEDNPSVRYFTLKNIMHKSDSHPDVRKAKARIMSIGPVPKILSAQHRDGYWGQPTDFYIRTKFKGTVWSLLLLAQLGADGSDERIKRTCEFILRYSQECRSGGFSYRGGPAGGTRGSIIPCLTGNMTWCLIKFGYLNDPRVKQAINWITTYQRFDDGDNNAPVGWPYLLEKCWGRHTCLRGAAKTLKALAEIPKDQRTTKVNRTISQGAEYLLKHHIYRRSHHLNRVSIPAWTKFGFPLMWDSDALEVLDILLRLGYQDRRMQEAIDLVTSKQKRQGKWRQENIWEWKLENTFNGRTRVAIDQLGRPSKWVTLRALSVINQQGLLRDL